MASYYSDIQSRPQVNPDNASSLTGQGSASQQPTQASAAQNNADNTYVPRPKRIACAVCRRRKLRCDGKKPSCGTCSRLGHECIYDEVRKKSGPKRGYVKQLEARLAQVETLLKTQEPNAPHNQGPSFPIPLSNESTSMIDVHMLGNTVVGSNLPLEGTSATGLSRSFTPEGVDAANSFGWDMISLGLEEPFPSRGVINELNKIYFEGTHPYIPVIHHPRYRMALDFAPQQRPPPCLQYTIWCHAASTSDKYSNVHALFYERARKYAEVDEMKGLGESILTLAHVQTWLLISCYEYKMMFFPRAWLSAGKAARLALMMGLHRLDEPGLEVKRCLSPPKDFIEREERRRVFWMTFCVDRYAGIGTGWPVIIDERDIKTDLPSNEEAFIKGRPEKTPRLSQVLEGEGLSTLSPFAGVAFMSCLFGRNLTHLHRPDPKDNDNDLNGVFWQRHRSHDNILLHFALSMPSHLRLPAGMGDKNVIFCNLALHTSTICLHQAAIFKAEKNNMPEQIILESKRRCIVAADQISSIMKMVSSMDMSGMNPFISFCVYIAARVFVQYLKFRPDDTAARSSLQFVFSVLDALKNKNPLTESFLVQLDLDIEGTPFQDIRLSPSQRHRKDNASPGRDENKWCQIQSYVPHTDPDSVRENLRADLPACLPNRSRPSTTQQLQRQSNPNPNQTPNSEAMHTSLPSFSKNPYHVSEAESGVLGTVLDIDIPSKFTNMAKNSAPEGSTPSTMNSSSSASFFQTDRSTSPKQSQHSSLNTSVHDPTAPTTAAAFDGTNLTQLIDTSGPSPSNPFLPGGIVTTMASSSSAPDRPQAIPPASTWDFPVEVSPGLNEEPGINLAGMDLDVFGGSPWPSHLFGSGSGSGSDPSPGQASGGWYP